MMKETALESIVSTFLNADATYLQGARDWARSKELSEPSREKRDAFKVELEQALVEPYPVSPQLFERWTDESVETQEEVQERLQELWNVCFGEPESPK
ncbi:hypothetical protein [Verrucomicrobium spinosum]|uniref:hypothetical protein n=1 Tax=Verrucomicrobium spinosum TaxID=2736 RepID=UPI0012F675BC|nr:hypothetical protein [Verrucomicrobium spinosum]